MSLNLNNKKATVKSQFSMHNTISMAIDCNKVETNNARPSLSDNHYQFAVMPAVYILNIPLQTGSAQKVVCHIENKPTSGCRPNLQ